jgi:Fic/DOC family
VATILTRLTPRQNRRNAAFRAEQTLSLTRHIRYTQHTINVTLHAEYTRFTPLTGACNGSAHGYYLAHAAVRGSLAAILAGENPGVVVERDHAEWYRQLFRPSVTAGMIAVEDLAGYRNDQVFIRNADHVPPDKTAVWDMMPTLFELLKDEPSAAVRAVLGHFVFVFIHPYMDGNGRMGRFLMNAMLASGGYPWTVIPVARRPEYLAALNAASGHGNIVPFAQFVASCVGVSQSPK